MDLLYWTFDESAGDLAANTAVSGGAYQGTLHAGNYPDATAPSFVSGVFGNAVRLPGEGKPGSTYAGPYVHWAAEPGQPQHALDLVGTDFTGGFHVRFETMNSGDQLVQLLQRGTFGSSHSFWIAASRARNTAVAGSPYQWKLELGVGDSSGYSTFSSDFLPVAFEIGEWAHVGFSFEDQEGEGGAVILYFNGEEVASGTVNRRIAVSSGNRLLRIGERSFSTYYGKFDGSMDDLFLTTGVHTFAAVPEPSVAALWMAGAGLGLLFWRGGRGR